MLIPSCGDEKDEQRKAHRDLLEEMANFFKRTYLIDLYTYVPANEKIQIRSYDAHGLRFNG